MSYIKKIEAQRKRFYSSAKRTAKTFLRSYLNDLMSDINKATSTQEIILISERQLKPDVVQKGLTNIYKQTLPFFANQSVKQLKPKKANTIETDYWDEYIKTKVVPKLANRITWITNTTEQTFKDTCRRLCAEGLAEGFGVDKIAISIMDSLKITETYRAERIARTEVISASNEGSFAGAISTGLDLQKEWIAYIDGKERDSHNALNGTIIDMDEEFSNGLQMPGDITGEAEEVINCRCTIGYVVKDSSFEFGREIPN